MSELTVEGLRQRILNLIATEIANDKSPLRETLEAKITSVAQRCIDADNENDINWDETNDLFGEYDPTNVAEITEYVPNTQNTNPDIAMASLVDVTINIRIVASDGKSYSSSEEFIILEKCNDKFEHDELVDSIKIKSLPYTKKIDMNDADCLHIYSLYYDCNIESETYNNILNKKNVARIKKTEITDTDIIVYI